MKSKYSLLIHDSFQEQVDAFLDKYEDNTGLIKQFRKIIDTPLNNPMKDVPPKLVGKVFHAHVACDNIPARKGFRLIYIFEKKKGIVLPVYVSLVVKSRFSYEKSDWDKYAIDIYEDLIQGNNDKFQQMKFISK